MIDWPCERRWLAVDVRGCAYSTHGLSSQPVVLSSTGTRVLNNPCVSEAGTRHRNPNVLAGLACGTTLSKIPAVVDALTGRFKPYHAFMATLRLNQIGAHIRTIEALTGRIEDAMELFRDSSEALIPAPKSPNASLK